MYTANVAAAPSAASAEEEPLLVVQVTSAGAQLLHADSLTARAPNSHAQWLAAGAPASAEFEAPGAGAAAVTGACAAGGSVVLALRGGGLAALRVLGGGGGALALGAAVTLDHEVACLDLTAGNRPKQTSTHTRALIHRWHSHMRTRVHPQTRKMDSVCWVFVVGLAAPFVHVFH